MTTLPCDVGMICPFCHTDADGMAFCSFPDIDPKHKTEYPLICNMISLDCELIGSPDSPFGQLLDGYDKIRSEKRAYWRTKVIVELK